MVVPEMERRSSTGTGTGSASYPSFSKEHSREAVHSRESVPVFTAGDDIQRPHSSYHTPKSDIKTATSAHTSTRHASSGKPPSPPLTEEVREVKRASIASGRPKTTDKLKAESRKSRKTSSDSLRPTSDASHKSKTSSSRRSREDSDASELSQRSPDKAKYSDSTGMSKTSYRARETSSDEQPQQPSSSVTQHTQDTQATEKRSDRRPSGHPISQPFSPSSLPLPPTPLSASRPVHSSTPASRSNGRQEHYDISLPPYAATSAPPPGNMPPPPPPIIHPETSPRVDYLLENGGLPRPTARTLLPRVISQQTQPWNAYSSPRMNQGSAPNDLVQMFAPVHARLQDYMNVIEKNGSIAVATGYRSVARRLLDRVATVFAREISNERCQCVMCNSRPAPDMSDEEEKGVSWGEILEFTVGRRELPQWPPFTMAGQAGGIGVAGAEPMQKIDPDVPPEWRDHYLRQNAKVKRAVEGWLSTADDAPTSAPAEVDDETLTFAITTHIQPERRPVFIALKRGLSKLPPPGVEPPPVNNKTDMLAKVSTALQRLYRLRAPPREAECCLYLLDNQYLHNTLATIAAVTDGEWDILVSGRFDGFLVSGAETQMPSSYAHGGGAGSNIYAPSRGPTASTPLSRTTTPFSPLHRNVAASSSSPDWPHMFTRPSSTPGSPSPGPSPAAITSTPAPAPVQVDEDTEISVLAEIEREILRGMEELEDQFEKLHTQAEGVRERLRARAAGLALMAKMRRGSMMGGGGEEHVGMNGGTPDGWRPYSGHNGAAGGGGERGWTPGELGESVFDDGRSELAPDDSASQIGGGASRRREHRRDGRGSRGMPRTPAPVAEVDEGIAVGGGGGGAGVGAEKAAEKEKEKKTGGFMRGIYKR